MLNLGRLHTEILQLGLIEKNLIK